MPALAPDEYDGLKESIRKHGVLYPIVVDTDANIIDGFNRVAIVRDLKTSALRVVVLIPSDSDLTPAKLNPAVTKAFPETRRVLNNGSRSWENTDPAITYRRVPQGVDMKEYARTLNLDRRHLTKAQRLELTADLVTRGASTRTIAVATGVSQSTAERDVKKVEESGESHDSPRKVTGKDGKQYPAKKKAPAKPKPADDRPLGARKMSYPAALALVPVGQRVEWRGSVGTVTEHTKAKGMVKIKLDGDGDHSRRVAVLDLTPVDDPLDALKVAAREAAIAYIEATSWKDYLAMSREMGLELSHTYGVIVRMTI
jgi:ParB-like chromosome segregation protein Spo0J